MANQDNPRFTDVCRDAGCVRCSERKQFPDDGSTLNECMEFLDGWMDGWGTFSEICMWMIGIHIGIGAHDPSGLVVSCCSR